MSCHAGQAHHIQQVVRNEGRTSGEKPKGRIPLAALNGISFSKRELLQGKTTVSKTAPALDDPALSGFSTHPAVADATLHLGAIPHQLKYVE